MGMTICLAPRGACGGGVFRSRFTGRVFGRASILASPSLERRRMTKMPPDGYPAFQYLQSVRVRKTRRPAEPIPVMPPVTTRPAPRTRSRPATGHAGTTTGPVLPPPSPRSPSRRGRTGSPRAPTMIADSGGHPAPTRGFGAPGGPAGGKSVGNLFVPRAFGDYPDG